MREIKIRYYYSDGRYITHADVTLEQLNNNCGEEYAYEKATEKYEHYSRLNEFGLIDRVLYTGLNDKNGVEVYDGDIVTIFDTDPMQVEFEKGSFGYWVLKEKSWGYFVPISGNSNIEIVDCLSKDIEVIGNIHESPELLEQA